MEMLLKRLYIYIDRNYERRKVQGYIDFPFHFMRKKNYLTW